MISIGYDPTLVTLSIAITVFAFKVALDVGRGVRSAAAGLRWA